MKVLLDLLKSSVLTQALITVIILAMYFTLLIMGRDIPQLVEILVSMVVSFYFGSKVGMIQGINQEKTRTVNNARSEAL